MSKPYQSSLKKSRDSYARPNASNKYSNRDRRKQYSSSKAQATSVSSVGNDVRPSNTATRGRKPQNIGNTSGNRSATRDFAVRSKARTPTRAYAIRAPEEASSPDVITGTFTLYDTNVIALIDLGSTYSYICMNLISSKTLPVEPTEFVSSVLNP
ncbi:Gag-Pol polyprotein [Gossypium australe]|uniref:Gag-Pol polyprotein n=1 Tax=Gossypium australe TaxID=47621 RepID=A0A5B6VME6_9ROSI|nr:Gag-Pol polyprotein [Gossypium australe]